MIWDFKHLYEPNQNSDDDEATIARDEDTHEAGELDELNADADIPIEDLLRKFHPELFDGKENNGIDAGPEPEMPTSAIPSEDDAMPSTSTGRGKRYCVLHIIFVFYWTPS